MSENVLSSKELKPLAKLIYVFIASCNSEKVPATKALILSSLQICEESYLKHINSLLSKGFISKQGGNFSEISFAALAQGFSVHDKVCSIQGFSGCEKEKRTKKEKENKSNYIYINSSSSKIKNFKLTEEIEEEDLSPEKLNAALDTLSLLAASLNADSYVNAFSLALKNLYRDNSFDISKDQLSYCLEKFIKLKPAAVNLVAYLTRFIQNSIPEAELYLQNLRAENALAEEKAKIEAAEKEALVTGEIEKVIDDFCEKEYPEFSLMKIELCDKLKNKCLSHIDKSLDKELLSKEIDELQNKCEACRKVIKNKYPEQIFREEAIRRLSA